MKELVLFLSKALADKPESVTCEQTEEGGTVRLQLVVAEEDKGRVIGKKGKVIRAMRSLLGIQAGKQGKKAVLDLD